MKARSQVLWACLFLGTTPFLGVCEALEIVPDSYSFVPAQPAGAPDGVQTGLSPTGERWYYTDWYDTPAGVETTKKLTDGKYGVDDWTSDHSRWLGWQGISWDGTTTPSDPAAYEPVNVLLSFNFLDAVDIGSIVLGINQDALYNWNVVFPSSIEIKADTGFTKTLTKNYSEDYSGTDNKSNNGKRHDVLFQFEPIKTSNITIRLNNSDNFLKNIGEIPWDNSNGSEHNGFFWIFVDEVDFYSPIPEPGTFVLLVSGIAMIAWHRRRNPI